MVEVNYGVWSSQLVYAPVQDGSGNTRAAVEFLLAAVQPGRDTSTIVWRFSNSRTARDTAEYFLVGRHAFLLFPGTYAVNIIAVDTNDRIHADTMTIPGVQITDEYTKPGLHLSSIELGNAMRYTNGEVSPFIKNGIEIIPNVLNRYDDRNLQLSYYAELYGIARSVPGDSFRVQTVIYDGDKNIFYAKTAAYPKAANSIVIANSLPIESLLSGRYYLRIAAFPASGKGIPPAS